LIGNFHLAAMDDMLRGEFSMAAVRHLMTGRVFFFMAGLAIENLVKGLLLHRGLVKVDSSQLPGPLNGHGINGKLGKLNIALSADETHMVKKYEVAVSWAGRYPVPVDTRRMPAGTGTITQVRDVADFLA